MGHATNKDAVLREITAHPGEVMYREDIAKTLNLSPGQVTSAVYGLMNGSTAVGDQLETVVRGRSWRWMPNGVKSATKKKEKRMFQEVGEAKAGVILECEDGTLWKAEQL